MGPGQRARVSSSHCLISLLSCRMNHHASRRAPRPLTVGGAAETAAQADAASRAAGEQEGGPGEQREQPLAPGAGAQPVGPQVEVVPPSGGGDVEKAGGAPGAAGVGVVGAPKTRAGAAPSTKRAESAAKKKAGKQVAPAAGEKAKGAAASSQRQLVPADPSIAANAGRTRAFLTLRLRMAILPGTGTCGYRTHMGRVCADFYTLG